MKKLLIAVIAVFALTAAHAQEEGKVRVGLEMGYAAVSNGGGFLLNLEPKYNIQDNMNVGLRLGVALVAKGIVANGEVTKASISGMSSYMGTYDYYFVLGGSFAPFVGAGVGYVSLASVSVDSETEYVGQNIGAEGKVGFMVRGGFEASKFRMTLEYDIIGKTKLTDLNGTERGSINNNYFGVTVGFYVGGGRW